MSTPPQAAIEPLEQTPLAECLRSSPHTLVPWQGALTPRVFSTLDEELTALTTTAGIYDLGYKAYLHITGSDRLRWLNGMVTNTIQALPEGHWNASFLLNAQGRIQGDANVYRTADALLFQTDRAQVARLSAHLDHFIIMDDVELQPLDGPQTTIGIAGPRAPEILSSLGLAIPEPDTFVAADLNGTSITLVHAHSHVVPHFEIWLPVSVLSDVWATLRTEGAAPCGIEALEALRILEAIPLYGIDIQERHLAQETGQMRMLNFNKGCYLGQEIVERVRSRATVHRTLRQFSVENAPAALDTSQTIAISAEGADRNPVGELTSVARYALPAFTGTLALGIIRTEAVERRLPLSHSGGAVTVLDAPPVLNK